MAINSKFFPPSVAKRTIPLITHNAPTGSSERPNHADFKTTEELKKDKFSGMRHNAMATQYEFWLVGEMVRAVSEEIVAMDEFALTKAHIEVFKQERGGFSAKGDF